MRLPGLRLTMVLFLLVGASAWGAKPHALAKEADRLYKAGKYREAAGTLREAYKADPNALYLYNIARALDQAGELEPALEAYRQYVGQRAEDTQPELVRKANLAMDRLRTVTAKADADRQVQEAEKKRLEDERLKAEAKAAEETKAALEQKKAFEAKEQAAKQTQTTKVNTQRIGAFVLGGVAVATLGTSLGFGLWATDSRKAFRSATTLSDKVRLEADTRTQALVTDLTLLLGLGTAVAAVIVYPKGPPPEAHVSVVVAPIAGGGIATVGGSF